MEPSALIQYVSKSSEISGASGWLTVKVTLKDVEGAWYADFNQYTAAWINFRVVRETGKPIYTEEWVSLRDYLQEKCPDVLKKNEAYARKHAKVERLVVATFSGFGVLALIDLIVYLYFYSSFNLALVLSLGFGSLLSTVLGFLYGSVGRASKWFWFIAALGLWIGGTWLGKNFGLF